MAEKNPPNEITFNPGDFIIREKTAGDALYIIQEGQLEVYKTGTGGEKIPIALVASGQYVGEAAVLLGIQNMSNVVALSPVRAVKLPKAAIDAQMKAVPAWLIALTKGLIERMHNANELMRKNGWVDESLAGRIHAVEEKFKKAE